MSLQVLACRRGASPTPIAVAKINPLPASPVPLWPALSPDTQAQLARTLANLLRRMLPGDVAEGTEIARVDDRQPR